MKIIKIAFALALINLLSSCYHDVVPHTHRAGDTYLVYSVKEITKSTAASLPVGTRVCIYCDSKNFPITGLTRATWRAKSKPLAGTSILLSYQRMQCFALIARLALPRNLN